MQILAALIIGCSGPGGNQLPTNKDLANAEGYLGGIDQIGGAVFSDGKNTFFTSLAKFILSLINPGVLESEPNLTLKKIVAFTGTANKRCLYAISTKGTLLAQEETEIPQTYSGWKPVPVLNYEIENTEIIDIASAKKDGSSLTGALFLLARSTSLFDKTLKIIFGHPSENSTSCTDARWTPLPNDFQGKELVNNASRINRILVYTLEPGTFPSDFVQPNAQLIAQENGGIAFSAPIYIGTTYAAQTGAFVKRPDLEGLESLATDSSNNIPYLAALRNGQIEIGTPWLLKTKWKSVEGWPSSRSVDIRRFDKQSYLLALDGKSTVAYGLADQPPLYQEDYNTLATFVK